VIAAYPITPQTHIRGAYGRIVANGELDRPIISRLNTEHSAMSACLGLQATGARTFTATAGQGLELMHEYYMSRRRCVCRFDGRGQPRLSSPLNVWGDQSDLEAVRDTGWIQIICENGQEAFDPPIYPRS